MVKLAKQVTIIGGVPAQRLVGFDAARTSLVILNNDVLAPRIIYIDTDPEVTILTGLPILSRGGFISLSDFFGDDPTLAYYAVLGAGTADVRLFIGKSSLLQRLVGFIKIKLRGA